MNSKRTIAAWIAAASLATVAHIAHANPVDHMAVDAPPRPVQKGRQISMERAISIAQRQVPGGRVKKVERDVEWGRLVYEVEIITRDRREYDIKVDAYTGKILSSRMEWDD